MASRASSLISLISLISPSSCTFFSTFKMTTPLTRKNDMPTLKKNMCRKLNVSMSSSLSLRNSSETLPTSFQSGPSVTMVERKRPIKLRPPNLASME